MANGNDFRAQRVARAEFARRGVNIDRADVYVMHGVCYVRGEISRGPGAQYDDLKRETGLIQKVLRQRPEIRDVVFDVKMPQEEIKEERVLKDYQLAA